MTPVTPSRAAIVGALTLVAAVTGPACSEGEDPPIGGSLLDGVHEARLLAYPDTNLPDDVRAALAEPRPPETIRIDADDWRPGAPLSGERNDFAAILGRMGDYRRWRAEAVGVLDRPGWSTRCRHEGRDVAPFEWPGEGLTRGGERLWFDPDEVTLFWWVPASRDLWVFATREPGEVSFQLEPQPTGRVERYEWRGPAQPTPAELVRSLTLGRVTRRVLMLPAPAVLETPSRRLLARQLELAVGVVDHGFVVEDGLLHAHDGAGDGVTFAVDAVTDDGVERLWSRHVDELGAFQRARVDLSRFVGRSVALRLCTEPGPGGDPSFDYAVWGDLRLSGGARRAPTRPHVILVDVDTLRADRVGCYGAARSTTPRLDAWAERVAVVHRDAVAVANRTLPSTASMLTGLDVNEHGVIDTDSPLTAAARPIALTLREAGYDTWALTDRGYVDPAFGFHVGFDRFEILDMALDRPHEPDWTPALDWLAARDSERPAFLFLQTYMVHAPYHDGGLLAAAPSEDAAWLGDDPIAYANVIDPFNRGDLVLDAGERAAVDRIYDEGVLRMDAIVGAFLERLEETLAGQPRLVVLTSDHGEELFERDGIGHGHSLYDELLRVPLIVSYPGDAKPGTSEVPVSSLDIVPTILDVVGLDVPTSLRGRSLRRLDGAPRIRVATHPHDLLSAHYDGYKLLQGVGTLELYDLGADAGERANLVEAETARLRELQSRLARYREDLAPVAPAAAGAGDGMEEELAEQLRALGYLGESD